jgi:hypothetical protein
LESEGSFVTHLDGVRKWNTGSTLCPVVTASRSDIWNYGQKNCGQVFHFEAFEIHLKRKFFLTEYVGGGSNGVLGSVDGGQFVDS